MLLTFSDILGKVVCPGSDLKGWLLVVGIGGWEAIPLGHWMCFRKKVLIDVDNSVADVLCSLSMIVCGNSENAQYRD